MTTIAFSTSSDRYLERRIRLFLEQLRLTRSTRLTVTAERGIVTLSGTAPTFHQRQLLVASARRVAGTLQVLDELQVDPPRVPFQPPRGMGQGLAVLASSVALIAVLVLAGCGRSGPSRVLTHPTKGSISYQGQPASGAFLALHPKNNAQPEVPTSTAIVQPDGSFAVSTYDSADGVPEGEYVVTIQWRKAVKSGGEYLPGPNLLPAKYSRPDTSDLVVRVAAGKNDLAPIALKR